MMTPQIGARVALYCRVSTQEQARSGLSLDHQEAKMRLHCDLHGYSIVEVIRDEGHSAKTLDRPGMQRVRELLSAGSVDAVVAYKLDRLTRSVRDFGQLLEEFEKAGVAFEAVTDRLDTGSPSGRLVVNIMVSVAQWEREEAASRTRDALAQAKARGVHLGKPPVGWKVEGGRLVPGERIGIVQQVHALRSEGLTLQQIAERMNELGIPSTRGGVWRVNTVSRALKAPLPTEPVEPIEGIPG